MNISTYLKEYRGPIFFILRFLGVYLIGNLLYGLYVTAFYPAADPVTVWVTRQTAFFANAFFENVEVASFADSKFVNLSVNGKAVLSVFEGCNGINVFVVFLSFIFAYSYLKKPMLWFIPLGLLAIHALNILRIALLIWVTENHPKALYFTHKYLFTAFIFAGVFVLWILWVVYLDKKDEAKN